jgi:hypothetical protein
MRALCIAITALLLLAGCGTGAYEVGDNHEIAWSLDDAMSRVDSGDRHVFLAALCDLYKQANQKDRRAIVQKYWYVLLGEFQDEGHFRSDEVESLRAMADPDFRLQLDKEIAAIEEERARKEEHAKAEEATRVQQRREQCEADLRQLKEETTTLLEEHSHKPLRNMTVFEITRLLDDWQDLQLRWLCSTGKVIPPKGELRKLGVKQLEQLLWVALYGTAGPEIVPPWMRDPSWPSSDFPRIDFVSRETFYAVLGKPQKIQTRPGDYSYWFLYEWDGNTIQMAVRVFENRHQEDHYTMILLDDFAIFSSSGVEAI